MLGTAAHDDVRTAGDVVHDVIADVRDGLLAARHLPHAVPQLVSFELEELGRRVALDRNGHRAVVEGRLAPEDRRHFAAVLVEELLVGDPRGASANGNLGHGGHPSKPAGHGHVLHVGPAGHLWTGEPDAQLRIDLGELAGDVLAARREHARDTTAVDVDVAVDADLVEGTAQWVASLVHGTLLLATG